MMVAALFLRNRLQANTLETFAAGGRWGANRSQPSRNAASQKSHRTAQPITGSSGRGGSARAASANPFTIWYAIRSK